MAELIKTWSDGGTLLVDYTGSGNGSITVSGDANSGEARSMELSVRAGSLVRSLTVNQATRPIAFKRLDYIKSDGATVFDTGETNVNYQIMTVLDDLQLSDRYIYYNGPKALQYTTEGFTLYATYSSSLSAIYYITNYAGKAIWAQRSTGYACVKNLDTPINISEFSDYDELVKNRKHTLKMEPSSLILLGRTIAEPYDKPAKLYRVAMADYSNNVKHNWVPCMRTADGVVGLYDLVKGTFLPPAVGSPSAGTVLGDVNDFA